MKTFTELGGALELLGRYAVSGDTRWSLSAPSIGWSPSAGYRVVYRSSNHYLLTDGSIMLTHGEVLRSRLYAQELSDDLEKLSEPSRLLTSSYRTSSGDMPIVRGVGDVRLFWRPEGWHLICNLEERGGEVGLALLKGWQEARIAALKVPKGAPVGDWIPAAYGGSEGFDFILPRGGVIQQKKVVKSSFGEIEELRHFFGGPPVVPLDDGTFLGAPYSVDVEKVRVYTASRMAYINGENLRYTHRFVRYSESGTPVEMSEPWTFESGGVEKCAGLVHWGDDFVMTYGRNDVSSVMGRISQRKVLKLLKKV